MNDVKSLKLSDWCQVSDSELADVAAVSAGNNNEVGQMIAEAMGKVGRTGVITLEEAKSVENNLYVVEGMQFDRGYISPYFVSDPERMSVEYENAKVSERCQGRWYRFFVCFASRSGAVNLGQGRLGVHKIILERLLKHSHSFVEC